MKKIILLPFLLVLLQGNTTIPTNEEWNQEIRKQRKIQYENKTINCPIYARKFESEYSYKTLYDYCCISPTADLDHRPSENAKPEINSILNAMLRIEKECGERWNECLRKELKTKPTLYMCNKLANGRVLEWAEEDLF